jgi:hypothetical protein
LSSFALNCIGLAECPAGDGFCLAAVPALTLGYAFAGLAFVAFGGPAAEAVVTDTNTNVVQSRASFIFLPSCIG